MHAPCDRHGIGCLLAGASDERVLHAGCLVPAQSHRFCPRCGQGTRPAEGGLRRRCLGEPSHKIYPRTDPVVIMLVESPDGNRALLGRR
jgi:NAD+ diphosphatase